MRSNCFKTLQLILLICLFSQSNGGDPCPPKRLLSPCTCSQKVIQAEEQQLSTTVAPAPKGDAGNNRIATELSNPNSSLFTTVECKGIKSQNDLEDKFANALDRKWVDKLILWNIPPKAGYTLAELPRDWLNNVRIQHMQIQKTQLSGDFIWKNQPLRFQTQSLRWLVVNKCNLYGALTYDSIGSVQTRGLNTLLRLQGIDFSSNHLVVVAATAFRVQLRNLTTVILAKNNIQDVQRSAFSNIPLLKHVDLSHNQLATILRNAFASPATNLEHIDLSWNSIQSLPADFFNNMPALKSVNISYNFLFSLPEKPWSTVWPQLTSVSVLGNFIECRCELSWMLNVTSRVETNQTSTQSTNPGAEQLVRGQCAQPLPEPATESLSHDLSTLNEEQINC